MHIFYAVIFMSPVDCSLRKVEVDYPNPDPGGIAEDILNELPHAASIILIDGNFRVVNQYRNPKLDE